MLAILRATVFDDCQCAVPTYVEVSGAKMSQLQFVGTQGAAEAMEEIKKQADKVKQEQTDNLMAPQPAPVQPLVHVFVLVAKPSALGFRPSFFPSDGPLQTHRCRLQDFSRIKSLSDADGPRVHPSEPTTQKHHGRWEERVYLGEPAGVSAPCRHG